MGNEKNGDPFWKLMGWSDDAGGRVTEPPLTKVEGFSGLERLRRTVEIFSD